MKIGFVTSYSSLKPAGLERFLLQLLKAASKHKLSNDLTIYTPQCNGLYRDLTKIGANSLKIEEVRFGGWWKEIGLFFAPQSDVYVFNSPLVPLFFNPKNSIVIVYDFAYKYFKDNSLRNIIKRWYLDLVSALAFRRATWIVSISEATKNDLIKFFKVVPQKIKVIYPGDSGLNNEQSTKPSIDLAGGEGFFLYVGTVKERKNLFGVLSAFALLMQKISSDVKLVVVGKLNENSEYVNKLRRLINEEKLKDHVIFTGHLTDGELIYLYNNAVALVFPSLLEGFGFPVVEAMSRGLPVITSKESCLSEIAGEAALLVDPLSYSDITEKMRIVLNDENLREDLKMKGKKRAVNFTWEKAVVELHDLLSN